MERILDISTLRLGDVVLLATRTREDRWWRRFTVVTERPVSRYFVELTRLQPDMTDPDMRRVEINDDAVLHLVPNEEWPEGVSAMYTKALAKGQIKLD